MAKPVRLAIFACALAFLAASAKADPVLPVPLPSTCVATPCIDFGGFGDNVGTVSYAGGLAPLVGSNLLVRKVWGFGTPAHSGIIGVDLLDGQLNFVTGPLVSFTPLGGYFFGGGGSFTITGRSPDMGITENAILAQGTFTGAFAWPGFSPFIFGPSGIDTKNPLLVSYFGFERGTSFKFGGPTFLLPSPPTGGGAFSEKVLVLDVPNTPTPEPASLLLLGSGLVAAGYRKWRKRG